MKKVKCNICSYLKNKRCTIKNDKVNINKKRLCQYYDEMYVDKSKKPIDKPVYVPYHLRSRKNYKEYVKSNKHKSAVGRDSKAFIESYNKFDSLYRYRSTADR